MPTVIWSGMVVVQSLISGLGGSLLSESEESTTYNTSSICTYDGEYRGTCWKMIQMRTPIQANKTSF